MKKTTVANYMFDGVKAVPVDSSDDSEFAWAWTPSAIGSNAEARAWKGVGHLRRSVELRANAVAACPRYWYRKGSEKTIPEESLPWGRGFGGLLRSFESSLCIHGSAYAQKGNAKAPLKWLTSSSINVKPAPDNSPPYAFERWVNGRKVATLAPDELVHVWGMDPFREFGASEPLVRTALTDAGIVFNISQYAASFFERGAIGSKILSVLNMTNPDEKARLKRWWERVALGIRNAFATEVFQGGQVTVTDLSTSARDLAMPELSQQAKEAIATTMGIPYSMLFSDAASYATASQDEKTFYSLTIIPQLQLFEGALNAQFFEPLGFELWFAPEESAAMRVEAATLATSVQTFTGAGLPLDVAVTTAGVELDVEAFARIRMKALMSEGLDWDGAAVVVLAAEGNEERAAAIKEKLALLKPPAPPAPPAQLLPPAQDAPPDAQAQDAQAPATRTPDAPPGLPGPGPGRNTAAKTDLAKWERKALKALDRTGSPVVTFEDSAITPATAGAILGALKLATDRVDVRRIFFDVRSEMTRRELWGEYP